MRGQAGVRLVPRWYPPVVIGLLSLFTLGFLALALNVEGAMGISAWGLFAFAALLLCAAVSALARPSRGSGPSSPSRTSARSSRPGSPW